MCQLLQLDQTRQFDELAFHQFQHDRLLRVQPVLRLHKHQRPWRVDDIIGNFIATVRRQAVQKDGIRLGAAEQSRIDLVRQEDVFRFSASASLPMLAQTSV